MTGYVLAVWNRIVLEEVVVSSRNECISNRKMKGKVSSRGPSISTTRTT